MKSTRVIDKITNNIDENTILLEECDELIDTYRYTRDLRELVISDQTMCDIVKSYSSVKSQKILLNMAFKSLRTNNMMEFRRIICEQKDVVNIKHDGTYLIHEACRLGNADFVCLLLFLGAKCDTMDDKGLMAQHYAVISNDPMCIDILFLFGNHMDVKDMYGNSPYEYVTKILPVHHNHNDPFCSPDKKERTISKNKKQFMSSDELQNIMNQYETPYDENNGNNNENDDESEN